MSAPAWLRPDNEQNPRQLGTSLDARRLDAQLLPALPSFGPRPSTPPSIDSYPPADALRYIYRDQTLTMAHVAAARALSPFGDFLTVWTRIAAVRRVVLGGRPAEEPTYWPLLDRLADHLIATGIDAKARHAAAVGTLARDPAQRVELFYPDTTGSRAKLAARQVDREGLDDGVVRHEAPDVPLRRYT